MNLLKSENYKYGSYSIMPELFSVWNCRASRCKNEPKNLETNTVNIITLATTHNR